MEKMKRNTRQRTIILEELNKCNNHPSADEVYDMVRQRIPRVSLGTVYRNLEKLSEEGVIQKLEAGGGQKRFDPYTDNHLHFRCVKCGKIEDMPFDYQAPEIEEDSNWMRKRNVRGCSITYYGMCQDCKN